MPYNLTYDTKSDPGSSPTYPVLLDEAKTACRVSPTQTQDDDLISNLIIVAIQAMEVMTGLSLIPASVTCILQNECGNIELPRGPVTGDVEIKDVDDNTVTEAIVRGLDFKYVVSPKASYLKATYDAGYTTETIPQPLRRAILTLIAFLYEHRGDEIMPEAPACSLAWMLARPYSRITAII